MITTLLIILGSIIISFYIGKQIGYWQGMNDTLSETDEDNVFRHLSFIEKNDIMCKLFDEWTIRKE